MSPSYIRNDLQHHQSKALKSKQNKFPSDANYIRRQNGEAILYVMRPIIFKF